MENKAISRSLRLLAQLMELHEENPFKIKSVANAAFKIDKLPFAIAAKPADEIGLIDGIGKSIAAKLMELLTTGTIQDLEKILLETPPGIVEMLAIKGIGPKKIGVIWRDLKIENVGELYYACNENRLIEAKGFGLKTQEEIKKIIEFKMAANGKFLYAHLETAVNELLAGFILRLQPVDEKAVVSVAGDFRRCAEIVEELIIVVGTDNAEPIREQVAKFEMLDLKILDDQTLVGHLPSGLHVQVVLTELRSFPLLLFKLTGNSEHVTQVTDLLAEELNFESEKAIYAAAGLPYIEPELRENNGELQLAKNHQLPDLILFEDLKGSLHNHSDWSDGVHTLEEMAIYCKEVLKLDYLGISDHSKSAFYAKGLSEQRVEAQHRQIDELNAKLSPFKIFKGIESDILNDGSLDYSNDILATFDFVVASVHSNLRMAEDKATARLIKAIENPFTTILGHPTGRLLLTRKGYPIDYQKIIDACAANGVAIEINSNPLRLDLDWRWHQYALEKGVLLAINPDAHRKEGFHDMRYGVMVARKGGLSAEKCLNAFTLQEITKYFKDKSGR